jgi:RNA polymerase sigma-70 factor (ECF subfamily)
MSSVLSSSTSTSLIERVRERDAEAWSRLARLYTPLVYRWARQCGLQSSDAADVSQEVFMAVATHVDRFGHRGGESSFRGWLWTIARNQIRLHYRKKKVRPEAQGGPDAQRMLQEQPDLLDQTIEPSSATSRKSLVHRALELIRQDFQQQTWQAFLRLAVAGQSAVEIAEDLGMTPAAVRQAKYRVLCRLHEELRGA